MKGKVIRFYRNRGFGFIKPANGGKQVLVHWSKVLTDDKWPFIKKGTEVEFELLEKDDNGKRSANNVTLVGGEKIPIFIPDTPDRECNDEDIYSGTVKFYDSRKGFGVIQPDDNITWEDVTSDKGIFFSRDAIISTEGAKGYVLKLHRGTKVTFKVYKDKKGLGAHELQNEDGNPLEYEARKRRKGGKKRKRTSKKDKKKQFKKAKVVKKVKVVKKTKEELLDEREVEDEENIYTGTVKYYREGKDFGFISIENDITFKDLTASSKIYVMKEDIICYSDEVGLNPDTKVIFKVYKDSMGLGAYEVTNEDGTPIIFEPVEEEGEEEEVQESEKSPEPAPVEVKKSPRKVVKRKNIKKVVKRRSTRRGKKS